MTINAHQTDRRVAWSIFCAVFILAVGWCAITGHIWEDYYITFRSSKNLATGFGLVFNHGERLHTFTSPLGVLLPAVAVKLTGNASDTVALWVFRVWSGLAFAGAAVLLYAIARRFRYAAWATVAVVGFMALDAKSIDFTGNGMETGFLLLFLAYTLWAMFGAPRRRWLHLGLAWGGLMWTRPDGFLYIAFLSAAAFFFNDHHRSGLTRGEWLKVFFQAGLVCTVVYLPWFLWSWSYYGSPIPHTVIAKENVSPTGRTVWGALKEFIDFPWLVWRGNTSLESTFLASYYQIGGWPVGVVTAARGAALLLAFQWIIPWWRMEIRVASFTFAAIHVYLSYVPFFPFPWYLPVTALLAAVAVGGMIAQWLEIAGKESGARRAFGRSLRIAVIFGLCTESWLTWQMMREMKADQELSSNAVRKQTGLWLKEHAKRGDTVFMEPLGYIGYFSELETYDFPGLSSNATMRAIRIVGVDWASLIEYLSPDWVVLRPYEIAGIRNSMPRVLDETYHYAGEFNNVEAVDKCTFYGRDYVRHGSHLTIFHRQKPKRYRVDVADPVVQANFPLPAEAFDGAGAMMYKLHAAGLIGYRVPADAHHLHFKYGLPLGTYLGSPVTDGARFVALFFDGKKSARILSRYLDPAGEPDDRGVQDFDFALPPAAQGERELVFISQPGKTDIMDWCCWSQPKFTP
ncbi:MAG TPA: hypothetical protein VGM64_18290 [Lacunisphaera sp.]